MDPYLNFEERFHFTQREKEVFRQISEGYSNGEIAANLFVSESTVKFHIRNILSKTSCHNRSELLKLFHETTLSSN